MGSKSSPARSRLCPGQINALGIDYFFIQFYVYLHNGSIENQCNKVVGPAAINRTFEELKLEVRALQKAAADLSIAPLRN